MNPIRVSILSGFVFTALAMAQSAPVGAPTLGLIPDAGSLLPVYGIPAAATAAGPIPGLGSLLHSPSSPEGSFALVSSAETGEVGIMRNARITPIAGAGYWPDYALLSPRGQSGLLFFSYLSRAQILTGLPDHPVWRYFDAPYLDPKPSALAVSDDGQWVAGAWPQGVYAFGPRGEVIPTQIKDSATSITFASASHNFFVATKSILQSVTDPGGRAAVDTVFTADNPLDAVGIATLSESVIVAHRDGNLTILNAAADPSTERSVTTLNCDCQPEGLFPMGATSFRLTGLSNGAFKLIDFLQPNAPQILYVPVSRTEPFNTQPISTVGAAQ